MNTKPKYTQADLEKYSDKCLEKIFNKEDTDAFIMIFIEFLSNKYGLNHSNIIFMEQVEESLDDAINEFIIRIDNNGRIKPKNDYFQKKYEEKKQDFINDIKENIFGYVIMYGCGFHGGFISIKETIARVNKFKEKEQKEWDNTSTPTKLLYKFFNRKKAPTLGEGYLLLLIILIFEAFFYERVALWLGTIFIFFLWRRKQVKIFNGGK